MGSDVSSFCCCRLPARLRALVACILLFVCFGPLNLLPVFADGCFVFQWNKDIDIKEPTQKAIIVYDAGREDLLLQVKYEGPLEEFGWLIPVPSLPTVEKGSMQPFYELSQLTQRQGFGTHAGVALSAGTKGLQEDAVKVIEVKTVGAYEVAVLSTRDSGSLERWLKNHDYSVPEGKTGIIDEYVHKGWYFVAAKIDLGRPVGFRKVSSAGSQNKTGLSPRRRAIRKQLSTGELHPLLISFDTPRCIYPLRISAVGGKPSEVSLCLLSPEALIDKFIFDRDLGNLQHQQAEGSATTKEQEARSRSSLEDLEQIRVASRMYALTAASDEARRGVRGLSREEIKALAEDTLPETLPSELDTHFHARPHGLFDPLHVAPQWVPACAKELPRLKKRLWDLTKQVYIFRPGEMHDLEFRAATAVLEETLSEPAGNVAASILASWDPRAASVLLAACQSSNALQRINASSGLRLIRSPAVAETLLTLLTDDVPEVRLNALLAVDPNWDSRFTEPLIALFRDPYPQIREQAVQLLCLSEPPSRVPRYLALLHDPNPEVQECALGVLSQISLSPVSRAELVRLLGSPRLGVVASALDCLRQDRIVDFLARRRLMEPPYPAWRETHWLSSSEAAPLTTNRLVTARLMGLNVLRQNADAQAVALALPLLQDTNSLEGKRAFALLHTVTGQDIPQSDPAKWEQWWAANKDTFVAPKQTQ